MQVRDDDWILLRSLLTTTLLSTAACSISMRQHQCAGDPAGPALRGRHIGGCYNHRRGLKMLLRRLPLWRILLATGLMVFVFSPTTSI